MESLKNRQVVVGQEVEVYFNLHRKKYSVRDKKTKLVLGHADTVTLTRVSFQVGKGKERVRQTKRKNVHAFAVGAFVETGRDIQDFPALQPAYYNPYTTDSFLDAQTNNPVETSSFVHCQHKRVYYQIH